MEFHLILFSILCLKYCLDLKSRYHPKLTLGDDFSTSSSRGADHSDYEAVYEDDDVDIESAVGRATAENGNVGQITDSVWDGEN